MSGLEIPALVIGAIGAMSSGVSAYKDSTRSSRSKEIRQVGNSTEQITKVCVAKGESNAGIKANGDMYAWSSSGGAAAYHKVEMKKSWG